MRSFYRYDEDGPAVLVPIFRIVGSPAALAIFKPITRAADSFPHGKDEIHCPYVSKWLMMGLILNCFYRG
jgi:hypothetical protein